MFTLEIILILQKYKISLHLQVINKKNNNYIDNLTILATAAVAK